MKKLGDKLYELRILHNLTQEQMGEKIGVTRQTISLWEADRRKISLEYLKHICEVFTLDLNYFLGNDVDNKDILLSDNDSEIVACTEDSSEQNENGLPNNEIDSQQKNTKSSATKKKLIAIIVVALLVGIVSVILGKIYDSPRDSECIETITGAAFNLGMNTIGWVIFAVAVLIASIVAIALIKRNKKKNIQK
ncbi:MAG: helix-turn-helix domain-containing protein [Clostridiales bacterium]|nr:helix-turn-helix domain-containing protein [Clostridiales bacterium]